MGDVQGRVTREIRADATTDTLYTYDLAGRLKTITDPKDQVTTHDSLSGTAVHQRGNRDTEPAAPDETSGVVNVMAGPTPKPGCW